MLRFAPLPAPRRRRHPGAARLARAALLAVLAASVGGGGARAQIPTPVEAVTAPTPDPRVLPGDLIRLDVWREPDWSGEFLVGPGGVVTLPWVGDLDVRGETQSTLKARLVEAYAREVRDAVVAVTVLKRVRVVGEVRSPGIFPVDPTQTVADALALAGGRSEGGRADRVLLRRGGETAVVSVLETSPLYGMAVETGDELLVPQRSWFSRNSVAVVGSSIGLLGLIAALLVR